MAHVRCVQAATNTLGHVATARADASSDNTTAELITPEWNEKVKRQTNAANAVNV